VLSRRNDNQHPRYFAPPQSPGAAMMSSALQLEKLKYFDVAFTGDGNRKKEIDTQIGKANADLREFYRSVVTKQELSNVAICKVFSFKSVLVPIIIYGLKSWIMTERILSQIKAAEMRFLRRVRGVTSRFTTKCATAQFVKP